jgi:hypothetical protein
MKNKTTLNKKTIEKIVLSDFKPSHWYTFKEEKKLFGITLQKEGIYNKLRHYYGETVKHHTVIDGTVMENPSVCFRFCSGEEEVVFFTELSQAQKFYDLVLRQGDFFDFEELIREVE